LLLKTDHVCPMCYYYSEHSWPCQKMLLAYSQMWGLLTLVQKLQEGVQSVCFCIPLHLVVVLLRWCLLLLICCIIIMLF
jgi:hypothetical protein